LSRDGHIIKDNHNQKEWQCSHQFCITDEYEKLELPPVTNGSTVHVVITPHILEIFEINDKESSITLSMYLGVKWEDSRIKNMNAISAIDDLQGVGFPFLSYLWQPDIEIHHVREVREPKVMGQFLAGLQINRGNQRDVLLSQVVVATVTCPMRFVSYPFDKHSCPFLFGSYTYDYNYMTFHTDNTFLYTVYQQNTNLDYDIEFTNATHKDSTYQDISRGLYLYDNGELGNLSLTGFNVDISRHYSKYLIVYYLPTGLFVVVSWTSFIIPPQVVAGRMGLLITILLCLVNIFNVVNNNSPSVKVNYNNVIKTPTSQGSKGVTALSVWLLSCIFFVFSAVMAYTCILSKNLVLYVKIRLGLIRPRKVIHHQKKGRLERRDSIIEDEQFYRFADVVLIIIFPLCFLFFNCLYWFHYLHSY